MLFYSLIHELIENCICSFLERVKPEVLIKHRNVVFAAYILDYERAKLPLFVFVSIADVLVFFVLRKHKIFTFVS